MIGGFVREAAIYSDRDLLDRALGELEAGWPAIVARDSNGSAYYLLMPSAAAGQRGSRLLRDLPLQPATVIDAATTARDAFERMREEGVDYAIVVDEDGDAVGVASLAAVLAEIEIASVATLPAHTALERAVAGLREGFVVLDEQNMVIAANESGRELLRALTGGDDSGPISALGGVPLTRLVLDWSADESRDLTAPGDPERRIISALVLRPPALGEGRTLILLRDVTRARRRRRHDVRRDQLADQGQFANAIAHDFANLLTIISAEAQRLHAHVSNDPVACERLASIVDAAARGGRLVRQLREFGNRSTGHPEILDVAELIAGMRPVLAAAAGDGVDLTVDAGADVPAILAEPVGIERALVNLVVNARHALRGGGRISIAVRAVGDDVPADLPPSPNGWVCVAVADNGEGMDAETLARCFTPNFTSRPGVGLGLGLATVRSTIERLGGMVTAESEPGRGTTIYLYIPAAHAAGTLAGLRVLVVDDERAIADGVCRVLNAEGARATAVDSAREALAHVTEYGVPDAIVADMRMPGRTGLELIEALRTTRNAFGAVIVSGALDHELRARARAAAAIVVAKPYAPDALVRAVAASVAAR